MIKVLSFLSNENCFAGHSRGPCGPRFEHHCINLTFSHSDKIKFTKINYPTPVKTEIFTPAPGPVFIQKSDSGSFSGFGKNRRLLTESTPAP